MATNRLREVADARTFHTEGGGDTPFGRVIATVSLELPEEMLAGHQFGSGFEWVSVQRRIGTTVRAALVDAARQACNAVEADWLDANPRPSTPTSREEF